MTRHALVTLLSTHSGLRGPADELTRDVLHEAVGGFVALLAERGLPPAVAVARDERPEGAALAEEVAELARWWGADVLDLGVAATPAAKVVVCRRGLGGALVVTGSHLDPECNGLKLVAGPDGRPVDASALARADSAARAAPGAARRDDEAAAEEHVAALCAAVDADAIRAAGLSVRASGGAGGSAALLLDRLGCAASERPAVGLRLDPDGDRLELDDERGTPLDSELTLALTLVATGARTIVKGADTSRAIDVMAARREAVVHVVAPGEVHLFDALAHWNGDLAGEGNGGVIVPAVGPGRDGLAAGAAILGLLARSGRPLSELAGEVPVLARRRSTLSCADREAARTVLERLGMPRDQPWRGLEVEDDAAWGLVRLSATEPVVRITTEAPTQSAADALHAKLDARLRAAGLGA